MKEYYLGIDIGATSGRHILAYKNEKNELEYEEIFRFKNKTYIKDNKLFWDIDFLFQNIIDGLKKCKVLNKIPKYIGIDTFGVDYAVLDKDDKLIKGINCYRDERLNKAKEDLEKIISKEDLYLKTGIFPNVFNTVYQLFDDFQNGLLTNAKTIMFLPCFLGYLLTDVKYNELSIASTSALLNKDTHDYDDTILNILGLNKEVFSLFIDAGSVVGHLSKKIQDIVGFDSILKSTFSHDTGAAVAGGKCKKDEIFISSGTWSLFGVVDDKVNATKETLNLRFTNELNTKNEVRFLKNIIGMFIINNVKDEIDPDISIVDVVNMAKKGESYSYLFDPTDDKFLTTQSMYNEIINDLKIRNISLPKNHNELYYCIYNSMAHAYKKALEDIEKITGKTYKIINIFGGGVNNKYLNKLTSKVCNVKVIEGPSEATALGNILTIIEK